MAPGHLLIVFLVWSMAHRGSHLPANLLALIS